MDQSLKIRILLLRQVLWLVASWVGGSALAVLAMQGIAAALGVNDFSYLMEQMGQGKYLEHINTVKIVSIVGHFISYTVSTLFFGYLLMGKKMFSYFLLDKKTRLINIPLTILLLIVAYPLALWAYYFNMQIVPASWIATDTLQLQEKMMKMDNVGDLISNIMLFGLVAGIGEELFFRGAIQRLMSQLSNNLDLAVWVTALLFSLIHFQPEGFLPRFLLGALLGYLLKWTGNLWASMIGHVTFNSAQVFIFYYWADASNTETTNKMPDFPLAYTLLFIGIFIFTCFVLWKTNRAAALEKANYCQPIGNPFPNHNQ